MTEKPPILVHGEASAAKRTGVLNLAERGLAAFPTDVVAPLRLSYLGVQRNGLRSLPADIARLSTVNVLDVSGNELVEIPRELGSLSALGTLDLSRNRLRSLPKEVGWLSNLTTLQLAGNELTEIPQEIGQLQNLQHLDISGNPIRTLPTQLGALLERGLTLTAHGCPLLDPIPGLLERGSGALATYLSSLQIGVAQYEAKVVFIGEGNVGKTSLVAALRGFPFVTNRSTTHGIEIRPLVLQHPRLKATLMLNTWDFGGQEVYRVTHQFFFGRRSLYIVVWNAREGQEQNEVEGWIRRIRLRAGADARTIIVATHCLERIPELDYPQLRRAFPGMLRGQYQTDSLSSQGVGSLRSAIAQAASGLPQMGQILNHSWIAARDEILALAADKPQIGYDEFAKLCVEHGLSANEVSTLAELLHDLGQIIYYGEVDGLRDVVVLNPEWLTKAIGYVLEDRKSRADHGILVHSRLKDIWGSGPDGGSYPTQYHPYFLRLMEKFDISYRLEGERESLVAQLVPYERPVLPWEIESALLRGSRSLSLICRLSEPAPGLVAWLTVRHHRASTGIYWRGGVYLRHPNLIYASEALVELREDRDLSIQVRAPSPDLYFNVLRDSVEDLIAQRWPGLIYQMLVPCLARDAADTVCSGVFPLDGLLRLRERGRMTVDCFDCGVDTDVSRLLTGFAAPSLPPQLRQLQTQISELADDVKSIERYAAASADTTRRVLKAVDLEVNDCPRLFTLTRTTRRFSPMALFGVKYNLTLWCESPGDWHVWEDAGYDVFPRRKWFAEAAPYLRLVLQVLRIAAPVSSAADQLLGSKPFQDVQEQLEAMAAIIERLPSDVLPDDLRNQAESHGDLLPSEGAALRSFRYLLFHIDVPKAFGGLRRVMAPSGEFLWVCPGHYASFDPGLPDLSR